MHAVKHAAATAKEKVSNLGAKKELKDEQKQIGKEEKAGKKDASNDVEKQEVKAEAHSKQADALRQHEEAKDNNAQTKDDIKADLNNRKTAAKQAASTAYDNPDAVPKTQ